MKKMILILLGFTPLSIGYIMDYYIMKDQTILLSYRSIGLGFLIFWMLVGFLTSDYGGNPKEALILVHSPALVLFLIDVLQILLFRRIQANLLGQMPQFYYLPLLKLADWLQGPLALIVGRSFLVLDFVIALLLMLGSYRLGSKCKNL